MGGFVLGEEGWGEVLALVGFVHAVVELSHITQHMRKRNNTLGIETRKCWEVANFECFAVVSDALAQIALCLTLHCFLVVLQRTAGLFEERCSIVILSFCAQLQ